MPENSYIILNGYDQLPEVKRLLWQYYEGITDYVSHENYQKEMNDLPGAYQTPAGHLLLLYDQERQQYAGCVALRKHNETACEIKRLYVDPAFRGKGYGQLLIDAIIAQGKMKGYQTILLDTAPPMQAAIRLYQKYGFQPTSAYYANPPAGIIFFKIEI